ncbi:MAG: glutathione S-transferase N-terminal domain-containing protein [Verrucomicrobiae bacterium]|nr:glutathione S-transferase N-terminal domain-containing protein [Verrucomicrobiae bacterium]MDW8344592.1 Uxx-star family glutaredoxin-like (seleno)protein [Verrucomicrobiae bacterium]
MQQIRLYTRPYCSWCVDAKQYLEQRGLKYEEVDVSRDPAALAEMIRISGQRYVPTIVVNGRVLANFSVDDLEKFLNES